jgi:cytoskeletal protein CcmA (bactofilin family)
MRTTGSRRIAVVAAAITALLVLAAAPAGAADDDGGGSDERVSITGPIAVGAQQRVDGAVISIDGAVRIAGVVDGDVFVGRGGVTVAEGARVTGTVTVGSGDARINGRVGDHVTVLRGRAILSDTAVVDGDVRSSRKPDVAQGADVTGDIEQTDFSAWFTAAGWALLFLWWLAVTITLLIVGVLFVLLLPGAAQAVTATGREGVGRNILWAVILAIALPIVAAVLAATVVGIPLAIAVMLSLALLFPMGYVVSSLVLGRLISKGSSLVVAFLIGFGILRLIGLIPGLGWIVGFLAAAYGLGVIGVAAWRAGRRTDAGTREPPPQQPAVAEAAG